MRRQSWVLGCVLLSALGGCSNGTELGCESTDRYAGARSAQPIQIPDDLSPPYEGDALRLPPNSSNVKAPTQPCVESPPSFYGEGRPTRTGRPNEGTPEAAAPAENPDRGIGN